MTHHESKRVALGTLAAAGVVAVGLQAARRPRASFRDKTVLVTGGSRGLGFLLARRFLREGARVAISAREHETLERARAELSHEGGEVLALPCDVRDQVQVDALVGEVQARLGAVDVLVNNAGILQAGPVEAMTLEDFREAMDTHFWGPLFTTLAVLPQMKQRGAGRIVNIASIGGRVAAPHLLPHDASKFALVGLSDGLRAELAQDGIRVTTVCPGLMRTGSAPNAYFKGDHDAEFTWFFLSDSLPGMSISAERAARAIVEACRRGDAELVLGLPARLAVLARAVAPGLTASLLAAVNRRLPQDSALERVRGEASETPLTRSWLTELSRKAAKRDNETGVPQH
ncbi:SDR family oxidoreductase [Myxococcaceae bacterium GXIMD 01537]